eukprot:TRINITY_DN13988_c0_g2_i5.p1 TRINITY_DN13988_c0_g2~~TRINITY_DN13988_c0_g2_i5.p1  ORF type:complete len:152 (+),score=46.44 TRINITY_DN13988_c0_g2_i5:3-458(+)
MCIRDRVSTQSTWGIMGCGPLKGLTRDYCLAQHFKTINVDSVCDGISNFKVNPDDLKELAKDRSFDRATICLTCGAIFVGNAEKHKADTGHHLFFQPKGFVCKKCNHDFTTENYDDDLKRMSDKLKSSYVQKIAKDAVKAGANSIMSKVLG